MRGPIRFLFGYRILSFMAEDSARLLNLCREFDIPYTSVDFKEGYVYIKASLYSARRLERICIKKDITLCGSDEHGVPLLIKRYRKRWGILVGLVSASLAGLLLSGLIWDVRIEGNLTLSDREVRDALSACGLDVGTSLRGLDIGVIENRVLIYSDDISWISVNIDGTVAEVEIRELIPSEEDSGMAAANLVAQRNGVIEYLEDVRGAPVADVGEAVSKGQLLVSGIYGSDTEGFRYTVAKGKVYARTERDISVEIPFDYDKKVYTGRVKTEKYLIFFKKEVKFYSNSGNSYEFCDTIDTEEYFEGPLGADLPIGVRTVKYLEYKYERAERSREDVTELAYYRLGTELERELADGELLSKRISFEIDDRYFRLYCHAEVIENIAKISEIEIEDLP